jgi:hypothetical protein
LPNSADGGGCQAAAPRDEQPKRHADHPSATMLLDLTTTTALPP